MPRIILIFCLVISGCRAKNEPIEINCPERLIYQELFSGVRPVDTWKECKTDWNCVIVPGTCDLSTANLANAVVAACFGRVSALSADCMAPKHEEGWPSAVCVNNRCEIAYLLKQ